MAHTFLTVFVVVMLVQAVNNPNSLLNSLLRLFWELAGLLWKPALVLFAAFVGYIAWAELVEKPARRQEVRCSPSNGASYETAVQIPQPVIGAYYAGAMSDNDKLELACHVRAMVAKVPPSVEKDLLAYYEANR